MTLQKRLKRVMRQRGWRVADLARELGRPYTTVREWVLFGRDPAEDETHLERRLSKIENPA